VAVFWLLRALLRDHGGDLRDTAADLRTAAGLFAAIEERWGLATSLTRLGATLLLLGDPAGAVEALHRARVPAAELGHDHRQRIWLATAHEHAGDRDAARGELAAVLLERPAAHDLALARLRLGELHRRAGDPVGADREHRHAARVADQLDAPDPAFRAEHRTAAALLALTRPVGPGRAARVDDARAAARAAVDAAPDSAALAGAGVAVAALRMALGDPEGAATALGAAHRLRGAADASNPDVAALTAELRGALRARYTDRYEAARGLDRAAATAVLTAGAGG
jgi:tetratricopeptide (TPR) repeat protein